MTKTREVSESAPATLSKRIGARIRDARRAAGLSRRELGNRADVSERYLVQLEGGLANPSIGLVCRLAEPLGIPVTELFLDSTEPVRADLDARLMRLVTQLTPREQAQARALIARLIETRRKRAKGIALLGLRGAGKSTLGAALADRLGLPFLSVTRTIEDLAGMSATELFNLGGADSYRRLEIQAIERIASIDGQIVVEAAGGIVANTPALDAIMARFATVWLKASPEDHLERVRRQGDLRPMRDNPAALENIRSLLRQREADYARADETIDTSGRSIDDALATLVTATARLLGVGDPSD